MNPRVDDIPGEFGVLVDGVRVLVMGTIERGRRGCACPENILLREVLNHLMLRQPGARGGGHGSGHRTPGPRHGRGRGHHAGGGGTGVGQPGDRGARGSTGPRPGHSADRSRSPTRSRATPTWISCARIWRRCRVVGRAARSTANWNWKRAREAYRRERPFYREMLRIAGLLWRLDEMHESSRTARPTPPRRKCWSTRDELGAKTVWDRHDDMQPLCGFGELGLCCDVCYMGPCRIDPFGERAQVGACGADAHLIVARNLARAVAVRRGGAQRPRARSGGGSAQRRRGLRIRHPTPRS